MNKHGQIFILFFYIGGLIISMLYGSAYLLTTYMKILNGSEINMGNFLFFMGVGALTSVMLINRKLLQYISALNNMVIGAACYSIGLVFLGIAHDIYYTYLIAILMGIGWGLIYAASVMAINANIPSILRKNHYSYYAATNALGAGMAPVIFHFLEGYGIGLLQFYIAAGLYAGMASVLCFLTAGRFTKVKQAHHSYKKLQSARQIKLGTIEHYAILMAFLSACIFSTLTFFQISFAEIYHQNYAVFFSLITITLILSRLVLIHFIAIHNKMLFYLSLIMLGSIIMFFFIGSHYLIYIMSAILFGISYGLIYPLVQTTAVAYAHESLHPSIITRFVFAYFIGIFCFPLASASVLVHFAPYMIVILLAVLATAYTAVAAKTLRITSAFSYN